MSREKKFRAWDGERMHYNIVPWQWDFVISLSWSKCEKSTGPGVLGSGGKTGEFLVPGIAFKYLMEFTGLHDKNGKEIYEGDILEFIGGTCSVLPVSAYQSYNYRVGEKLVVKSLDSGFTLMHPQTYNSDSPNLLRNVTNYDFWNHQRSLIVIGNIHDNPEKPQDP